MGEEPYLGGPVPWQDGDVAPAPRLVTPAAPLSKEERREVARELHRVLRPHVRAIEDREDGDGHEPEATPNERPVRTMPKREVPAGPDDQPKSKPERRVSLTPMSMVKVKRMHWLMPGRIPLRTVTVVAGRGGEGKSTWMLSVAARLSRGELGGDVSSGGTLIIGHEDDKETVLAPRLIASGIDMDLVTTMAVSTDVDSTSHETIPVLPLDVGLIRDAIRETGARLVIIDPLSSLIDGNTDKLADVRRSLDPLTALAAEMDVAVVAILHLKKGGGNLSDLVSGSHAFRDVARSTLLVATNEETGERIVTIEKSNYSQSRGESFKFKLESVDVPTEDGETTTVARAVDLGASDVSVDDLVNGAEELSKLSEDMAALAAAVSRHGGEGIGVEQAVIEAGFEVGKDGHAKARRYLSRLAQSGRIERASRGRYRALGTGHETPVSRVRASVPTVLLEEEEDR